MLSSISLSYEIGDLMVAENKN